MIDRRELPVPPSLRRWVTDITEFRRLVGVPPAAFLAGHRPSPTPCQHPPA